jgi:hypothetical protein
VGDLLGGVFSGKPKTNEGSYESKTAPSSPPPAYKKVECWLTRDVGGLRVVIFVKEVTTDNQFFFHKTYGGFYLDTTLVRYVKKLPILIYDELYTAPMEVKVNKQGAVEKRDVHIPLVVTGEEIQFSKDVDMILKGEVVKQAVAGSKGIHQSNQRETIMWLIVGAIAGTALGYMIAQLVK